MDKGQSQQLFRPTEISASSMFLIRWETEQPREAVKERERKAAQREGWGAGPQSSTWFSTPNVRQGLNKPTWK